MNPCDIQDILPLVCQPSRYLGSEVNRVRKDPARVGLRVALAYPDLYEVGTSHFGLQILYGILNRREDIAAERVFTPGQDMEARLREAGLPLTSLESGTPLSQFDIIGISLLYELNLTNVLTMLDLSGIPFFSRDRGPGHPLVIAGGPCTVNPEPVADFFDAVVVGDGEEVLPAMADLWLDWKVGGDGRRETLLRSWSRLTGVYIPAFFEARWDDRGFQTLSPRFSDHAGVRRAVIASLDRAPFPKSPVIPFGRPVHDRLRLEVARGCTRGCRFCQAGMIYRPVRERSPGTLMALLDEALAATGYEDLSLLSLSTGDYGCIAPLLSRLMARYAGEHLAVSLPSLRAGTLTPELMAQIKKVRKTGFTIAPEAGSQRLRNVINKNIRHEDILNTVSDAFSAGWQIIKLYFMVGLPTETEADVEAIVDLVKDLRRLSGPKGRKGKINVSVGTFIPKSHTPFQWCRQLSIAESREKIETLKERLRLPGVQVKWQDPEVSFLEGVFARGDRRLAPLLVEAYRSGCRFDGWGDQFRFDLWRQALASASIDADFFTTRPRETGEPLPWDHIDTGVTREFLRAEWDAATAGETTGDCRSGGCNRCGVCDFDTLEPVVFGPEAMAGEDAAAPAPDTRPDSDTRTLQVDYSKLGPGRYFGHLEMVNIFMRAIRRAGIPVKYSSGFHPMPRISFNDPLPLGMESEQETFYLTVPAHVRPSEVPARLNASLPEGLAVEGCRLAPSKSARQTPGAARYRLRHKHAVFDGPALEAFAAAPSRILTRTTPKGREVRVDLKEAVIGIDRLSAHELEMTLGLSAGSIVRPGCVIQAIFDLPEDIHKQVRVTKLLTTREMDPWTKN
ncbi:TIGR03960 family B12-binding radical SAM protein [Desulfococcus sp.]|uniref:TIGR03960 family B12-binding radical SAM protein n=1 Tax=Desulfococcus sp. TaxID=2025834 RepID=UPI003594226D